MAPARASTRCSIRATRCRRSNDSLLGKLIVWAEDRETALARLERALGELTIGGLKTTKPLHQALLSDAAVRAGDFHTRWLEPWLEGRAGGFGEQEKGTA